MDLACQAINTLRNAAFPVYAIPPAEWPGYVIVRRAMGSSKRPGSIGISYTEDLIEERPSKEIEVVSTGAEILTNDPPQMRDLAWEFSYPNEIINFTHPFAQLEERAVPGSERFNADMVDGTLVPRIVYQPSAGPRRLAEPRLLPNGNEIEPVAFEDHPELRCYRIRVAEVEVFALSWGYEDEYVTELLARLRPINDDPELFAEVERAEYTAWQRIRQRKGWESE